jgi:hypothetical protein
MPTFTGDVDTMFVPGINSNGAQNYKIPGSSFRRLNSVFGRTGAVVAGEADYQAYYPRMSQTYNNPAWINQLAWSKITGTPASLAGYGISDPIVLTTGSYSDPAWITSLAFSKLTGGNTNLLSEGSTNLYYTNTRSRQAISLTTTGNTGQSTYNSTTGVLNIPTYATIAPGGSAGYAQFNHSNTFVGTGRIYYDSTNGRIGFGTNSPSYRYDFYDNTTSGNPFNFTVGNSAYISFRSSVSSNHIRLTHNVTNVGMIAYGCDMYLGSVDGSAFMYTGYGGSFKVTPDVGASTVLEATATGSGKKNVTVTGSTLLNGAFYTKSSSATDADYTVQAQDYEIVLPAITANRILTMPAASTMSGRTLMIVNNNSSGNTWTASISLVTKTGSTITTIASQTNYLLRSDGTNWNIRLIY